MADAQIGSIDRGITYRNAVQGGSVALVAAPLNYSSITALKARLTAISGTAYSAANLNRMTVNDMVYALRLNDDPTTI